MYRQIVEANFAEPVLAGHAVAAVGGQTDVPGGDAFHIHGCVRRVRGLTRRLGELHVFESGPVLAVGGVLDGDVLEPEAEHHFEDYVVVPDPHLVELVDAVEFVLNPDRFGAAGAAQPHVGVVGRVLVSFVKAGTIDGVGGTGVRLGGRVARGENARDRIGIRLGGETPDTALEDRVVGSGVDLIDSPVVGLTEFEQARRIVRGVRLTLGCEHIHRIAPAGVVDIVK